MTVDTIALPATVEAAMAELAELYGQVTNTLFKPGNSYLRDRVMNGSHRFCLRNILPVEEPEWRPVGFYDSASDVRVAFGDIEGAGNMEGSFYVFFKEGKKDEHTRCIRIRWSDARSAGLHIADFPLSIFTELSGKPGAYVPTLTLRRAKTLQIKGFSEDGATVITRHPLEMSRASYEHMVANGATEQDLSERFSYIKTPITDIVDIEVAVDELLEELAFIKRGLVFALVVFAAIIGHTK